MIEFDDLQKDLPPAMDTIKQKDDMILFLQAHVSQITLSISQLALKAGPEEIKAKQWLQFWK
jgi:hypothetical protein